MGISLKTKFKVYGFLFLMSIFLFLPIISVYLADWSHPISAKKIQKSAKIYVEEIDKWEKNKKDYLNQNASKTEKELLEIIKQWEKENPLPPSYTIEIKWEYDDYNFLNGASFIIKKLTGIDFKFFTITIWICYIMLFFIWFELFKKSGLWHYNSAMSYLNKIYICQFIIAILFVCIGAYIFYSIDYNYHYIDPDIEKMFQKEINKNWSNLIISQPGNIITLMWTINSLTSVIHALWTSDKLDKHKEAYTKFFKRIYSPLIGTKIKINKKGKVTLINYQYKQFLFLPLIKRNIFKLSFGNFINKQKDLLLNGLSNKYVKQIENIIIEQLKTKFLEMSTTTNQLFEGQTLPKNLRYIIDKGDKRIVIIEQEPQIRNITFAPMILNDERKILKKTGRLNSFSKTELKQSTFHLAFPYTIFLFEFTRDNLNMFYAFWSDERLSNIENLVYQFALPNISQDGSVCLGEMNIEAKNFGHLCDDVIENFWQGQFSAHLDDSFQLYKKDNLKLATIYDWQRASQKDPSFMLRLNMHLAGKRIAKHSVLPLPLFLIIDTICKDNKSKAEKLFDDFLDDIAFDAPLSLNELLVDNVIDITPDKLFKLVTGEN